MRNKVAKRLRREASAIFTENVAKKLKGEKVNNLPHRRVYRDLKRDHLKTEIFVKDTTSNRQKYIRPRRYAMKYLKLFSTIEIMKRPFI